MQDGFDSVDHQSMAGIMAALKAHHRGGAFGQQIDHLAFALVTPLGADHDYVLARCGLCAPEFS